MRTLRHLLMIAALFGLIVSEAHTQKVSLKREAMSPGRRIGVTGPNYISSGMRVFAKGMKIYWSADSTGSGPTQVTSYDWTIVSGPTGSTATITAVQDSAWMLADLTGKYIIQVSVNGGTATAQDTVFASTYMGWPTSPIGCQTCHAEKSDSYAKTNHATIYERGLTGQLEVDPTTGMGAYGKSCARCHTTGFEAVTDNGNFGYLSNQAKWDSTWWKALPYYSGDYWIPFKNMNLWNEFTTNPAYTELVPVARIGCESCHGPGKDHNGDKSKIGVSFESGVCMQCHDAPNNHSIGRFWSESAHATMPLSGGESNRTGCFPCHNGPSLAAFADNPTNPDYSKTPFQASISCQSCHDPHDNTNPAQLRLVTSQPLVNGYVIPAGLGGMGQLCMNCHRGRYDSKVKVLAQANPNVYANRFYPHYSPQTDMFVGANAYEFDQDLSGLMTHGGTPNGCVTCHMSERRLGTSSYRPNHGMNMVDKATGKDNVEACIECHGEIEEFTDIRAMDDYDGDGIIESAIQEVADMMETLKARLPKNAAGTEVSNSSADSVVVRAELAKYPNILGAMWNYWFVKNDFSGGVHNTKYAVALLKLSFAKNAVPVGVEPLDQKTPHEFALGQNYPNPFNPSTTVQFSIPRSGDVQLHVFNSAGQLVQTLANNVMMPGNYATSFNATNLASGVYYYRISITSNGQNLYTATKRMVLTK